MIIEVTEQDIDAGLRNSCFSCPVARAFQRKLETQVTVGHTDAVVYRKGLFVATILLPEVVKLWIATFDAGKKVEPFSFEVDYAC